MSKPVYLLFQVHGFTEAWYQLSKEEQNNLWSKSEEIDKSIGAKRSSRAILVGQMRAALFWGVEEYPDMDAYQKNIEELEKLEWWRYISAKSILGTKWEE